MHITHIIRDWLEENGVWWLPYPSKSLDLNLIKYFWLKLKEIIFEIYPKLLIIGRGTEAYKYILVKAIHEAIAMFNNKAQ